MMPDCRLDEATGLHWRDRGDGSPLVLLHGWGMSLAVFAELEERLSGRFRCISIDLPGHGKSPAPEVFALSGLADAVGMLCRRLELVRPVLLGWSLGGMIALQFAAQRELCLAGLVLVGTTPRFVAEAGWEHGLPELQVRALRRDLQKNPAKALGGFFQLMFPPEGLPRERLRQIVRFAAGPQRLPDTLTALTGLDLLRQADLRQQLAVLGMPCLVMHGGEDRIVPAGAGRCLAETIPGADFALFPTSGHAPFLEQPDTFCRRLEGFLNGCLEA